MTNPVNVSEQDSRAMQFAKESVAAVGDRVSQTGAWVGMAADIGFSVLGAFTAGATSAVKDGVKIGVEAAKEGVAFAKAGVKAGVEAGKATLKASKGVLAAARAATPAFKTATTVAKTAKVAGSLVSSGGQTYAAIQREDTVGAAGAITGGVNTGAQFTISQVNEQQKQKATA